MIRGAGGRVRGRGLHLAEFPPCEGFNTRYSASANSFARNTGGPDDFGGYQMASRRYINRRHTNRRGDGILPSKIEHRKGIQTNSEDSAHRTAPLETKQLESDNEWKRVQGKWQKIYKKGDLGLRARLGLVSRSAHRAVARMYHRRVIPRESSIRNSDVGGYRRARAQQRW